MPEHIPPSPLFLYYIYWSVVLFHGCRDKVVYFIFMTELLFQQPQAVSDTCWIFQNYLGVLYIKLYWTPAGNDSVVSLSWDLQKQVHNLEFHWQKTPLHQKKRWSGLKCILNITFHYKVYFKYNNSLTTRRVVNQAFLIYNFIDIDFIFRRINYDKYI